MYSINIDISYENLIKVDYLKGLFNFKKENQTTFKFPDINYKSILLILSYL
jgi:hypothetical protein